MSHDLWAMTRGGTRFWSSPTPPPATAALRQSAFRSCFVASRHRAHIHQSTRWRMGRRETDPKLPELWPWLQLFCSVLGGFTAFPIFVNSSLIRFRWFLSMFLIKQWNIYWAKHGILGDSRCSLVLYRLAATANGHWGPPEGPIRSHSEREQTSWTHHQWPKMEF